MEKHIYATESGTVSYWTAGPRNPGACTLVFLPGLTADHTLFDAQVAHFSHTHLCIAWDAPAHGESRPYPLDFSLDDYALILHGIWRKRMCPVLFWWANRREGMLRRHMQTYSLERSPVLRQSIRRRSSAPITQSGK